MPLSNSNLFYRFQNLYLNCDLQLSMQENAAQSIRQNCTGVHSPGPSSQTSRDGARAERFRHSEL